MDKRKTAIDIFLAGLERVKPKNLIDGHVSVRNTNLRIGEKYFDLSEINNIYVVGAGKASAAMAHALETILDHRISAGHIVTKYGHAVPLKYIETTQAGHPTPDKNSVMGSEHILSIAQRAQKDDLVICLISGGGSSLLTDVPNGCTLEDLVELNDTLLKIGANITEINCIRKHLSKIKGGLLSKAAYPATVVGLILSDVVGNPIGTIASGPTAADPTTFSDALSILKHYKIENKIPGRLYHVLLEGSKNKRDETLKEDDKMLNRTTNIIIGTNDLALESAKTKAESLGYNSHIVTNRLEDKVATVAQHMVTHINRAYNNVDKKTCLLFAGEPTVEVRGNGLGGRNQHLALIMANLIKDLPGVTVLSGGTDGSDGPTDAAGAVVDSSTSERALLLGMDVEAYIENCDSYHFFKQEGGLFKTGPTQTNVMDLMIVLIE